MMTFMIMEKIMTAVNVVVIHEEDWCLMVSDDDDD